MKLKKYYLLSLALLLTACGQSGGGVTPSSSSSSEQPASNDVNVIILCGQSNAEGHTHSSCLQQTNPVLYNKYLTGTDTMKVMYNCDNGNHKNDEFENVKLGMGFNISRFGPEIGMAEEIEKSNLTRPVYLIKSTVGGTNLYSQWRSPSTTSTAGQLYNNMLMQVYEDLGQLEDQGLNPYIKGICWMQGEADSCNKAYADKYQEYEDNFINDLQEEFSGYAEDEEKIKFVNAGISDCSTWQYYQTVNDAKQYNTALDEDSRSYFGTIEEGLVYNKEPFGAPDLFHYDSLSMIKLGSLFVSGLIQDGVLE